ncbi:GNAT family N-acetyltransferase [Bifidobacterium cuniculi]|uniref:Acetyltransferase n=1 Tax=Bifidobacterium cuniculi TaxID=1688 RepID=A0A087B0J7_9BIFI|nr:GNAT family N-acetyltransferase [Bifidobacterium cuniculi]KFI64547.1 acetyltransferase [Bifidobacterium cuniculi]
MTTITLTLPQHDHEGQVMAARESLLADGADDGTAGLLGCATYRDWLDFEGHGRRDYGDGYVPSTTWLATLPDGTVVGFLDLRHELSDYLLRVGGHIGYSVLPTYRRRGYAKAMLAAAKDEARAIGIGRLLVTCHDGNVGSERTILDNGGQLENTVKDGDETVKRFWIDL